jgi:methylmalonyl-CoA/ethylmalonyl-CoA epimerase
MDPERYALQFHHLGLAVRAPERALRFLRGLGYVTGPACYDPLQRVNLLLCVEDFKKPRQPLDRGRSLQISRSGPTAHPDRAPDETAVPRPAHPAVELIYPEPGIDSPIDGIFAKGDELIYHLCYESPDPKASLAAIERDGNRVVCVSAPKPAVLFDQREVGFWYVRGFGVIEILARAGDVPAAAR